MHFGKSHRTVARRVRHHLHAAYTSRRGSSNFGARPGKTSDSYLLSSSVSCLGTAALVAGTIALRSNRGRFSYTEHCLDECRKGFGEPSRGTCAHGLRDSRDFARRARTPDSFCRIFSAESKTFETFCRVSGPTVQRLPDKVIGSSHGKVKGRTPQFARHWAGNCRFNPALCRQSSGFCGRCLYPADSRPSHGSFRKHNLRGNQEVVRGSADAHRSLHRRFRWRRKAPFGSGTSRRSPSPFGDEHG